MHTKLPHLLTYFDTENEWLEILCSWAASEEGVAALWLFGSRASGQRRQKENQPDVPDLDVALEVTGSTGEDRLENWFYLRDCYTSDQLPALPVRLDLHYCDFESNDKVPEFVKATGVLFYRRQPLCLCLVGTLR